MLAINARYLGKRPQNIPEYAAVYLAAKNAKELGLDKIIIRMDNTLVAKQLCGEFKVKSERLIKPHSDCAEALKGFGKHGIEIIPRSTNKVTHRMSCEAIRDYEKEERQEGSEISPERSFKPDGIISVAGISKGVSDYAAVAYVISALDETVLAVSARYLGLRPSNVAEYAAVYYAAKKAGELGLSKIVIRTDSKLVAKQLSGEFKVKSENLKKPYAVCMRALEDFENYEIEAISREANETTRRMASEAISAHEKDELNGDSPDGKKEGEP